MEIAVREPEQQVEVGVGYTPRTMMFNGDLSPLKLKKVEGTKINNSPKYTSATLKTTRRLLWDRKKGKVSKMNPEAKTATLRAVAARMGVSRGIVSKNWGIAGQISDNRRDMEETWKTFLAKSFIITDNTGKSTNYTAEILASLGRDEKGMEKREALEREQFQRSGGKGKMRPYYIANGVLRGGVTSKGIDQGNAFCIPIKPKGETRILQSVQAKYTNPVAWPSTRIIRYVRGHWGNSATGNADVNRELVSF